MITIKSLTTIKSLSTSIRTALSTMPCTSGSMKCAEMLLSPAPWEQPPGSSR